MAMNVAKMKSNPFERNPAWQYVGVAGGIDLVRWKAAVPKAPITHFPLKEFINVPH
jgi:hypothetical protein